MVHLNIMEKQMDKRSQEHHFSLDDSSADPIELIRERKRKKKEEYDKFKDHFVSD